MEWVGKMNSIKNAVEEIILKELIYVQEKMKMEDMKLYDIDSGELCELIDSKRIELRNKNENYKKLRNQVCEIKEKYPNILALIEDNEVENLNKEECKNLQKLLSLYSRMMDYEDREIFFLGARENYFYFKNLGILKQFLEDFLLKLSSFFVHFFSKKQIIRGKFHTLKYQKQATHLYSRINTQLKFP